MCFQMQTVAHIIQAFGGPTSFARAIGTTQQNATNMKDRGSIPPGFWKAIVDEANRRNIEGLTLEALADLAAKNWNRGKAA